MACVSGHSATLSGQCPLQPLPSIVCRAIVPLYSASMVPFYRASACPLYGHRGALGDCMWYHTKSIASSSSVHTRQPNCRACRKCQGGRCLGVPGVSQACQASQAPSIHPSPRGWWVRWRRLAPLRSSELVHVGVLDDEDRAVLEVLPLQPEGLNHCWRGASCCFGEAECTHSCPLHASQCTHPSGSTYIQSDTSLCASTHVH